jgi:hypothetical protein
MLTTDQTVEHTTTTATIEIMELGPATFADLSSGVSPRQRMKDPIEEGVPAEELFHNSRYVAQMSVGAVAHADVLRSMELFGAQVAPVVRAEIARREGEPAAVGV